ncbi:MAG: cytochrome b5-like heme/steroid binding domain-containing protein [Piptocephalis tieghemiana]|nr:MAG: cytochrome b5-like heme/steroid binding domain-containing protein [Piptocephalis tieghemiana]
MYSLPPLSWDAAIQHLRGNPLNWALASLSLYYLGQFLFPSPPPASVPKGSTLSAELRKAAALSPDSAPLVFKDYTPEELCAYTGRHGTRILIGVRGRVFDATSGARFYGPDGPYGNFAGHDATRGLAKGSFDDDMITPPDQPLDKLEDLTEEDWESLRDWEGLFESKYPIVGNLVNPPSSSMGSQA